MGKDIPIQPWSLSVKVPSTIAHIVGILATVFRLLDRWHLSRFWWEDTWATLALICDFGCLASVWMQITPQNRHAIPQINVDSNWLTSLTITSVLWFARMSILCSIVRIANPSLGLRRVAYGIGAMFLVAEAALLAQKVVICIESFCRFTNSVALTQLITDVISDIMLVAASVRFLRDVKLSVDQRILITSAFSASILITGVTIIHSVLLLEAASNATFVIGHVKAALALFLCNALVLSAFIYRMCRLTVGIGPFKAEARRAGTGSDPAEFTSVIELPSKFSSGGYPEPSETQNRGDATHTMTLTLSTLSTSAGPDPA